MPRKPMKPCKHPGCPLLTATKYCDVHAKQHAATVLSSTDKGYDGRWRKAKKKYLEAQPLCVRCMQVGALTRATVVDHIIPHRGDMILFWDETNWQPLCTRCHNRKTRVEDMHVSYKY